MSSFPSFSQKNLSGNRFQIRGFPKIWTDKLTFDDIAWYLYDLLVKYGAIENIVISCSKKDMIVYGIVDMKSGKGIARIKNEMLDKYGKFYLQNWDATLSFRQVDADTTKKSEDLTKKIPLKDLVKQLTPPQSTESYHSVNTADKGTVDSSDFVYSREFLLSLRGTISPSRYQTDPQFSEILRSVENIDYGYPNARINNFRSNNNRNFRQNETRGGFNYNGNKTNNNNNYFNRK
uniref:RRM domain-containing protein n=1 Tax=Meloidogyne incognita TaxID=6306 RepID=A0A914NE59_MELIC